MFRVLNKWGPGSWHNEPTHKRDMGKNPSHFVFEPQVSRMKEGVCVCREKMTSPVELLDFCRFLFVLNQAPAS